LEWFRRVQDTGTAKTLTTYLGLLYCIYILSLHREHYRRLGSVPLSFYQVEHLYSFFACRRFCMT